MSSSQILQGLLSIPARARQAVASSRNRVATPEKQATREGRFLRRSLAIHRPVWATGGGAMYTTATAVFLTLRYLRKLR